MRARSSPATERRQVSHVPTTRPIGFIAEYAEHLSDADAIADLTERPDDYFQSLWLESLLANRLGHRPPHPWFIEFCLRDITRGTDDLVRGLPVGG